MNRQIIGAEAKSLAALFNRSADAVQSKQEEGKNLSIDKQTFRSVYKNWGVASHEHCLEFPCDRYWDSFSDIWFRGITIHAEPEIIFQKHARDERRIFVIEDGRGVSFINKQNNAPDFTNNVQRSKEENLMGRHPIEIQIEKADKAIVAEDFETLLDIYTDDAVLVIEPGRNAKGKESLRNAFEAIAVYFKNGLQVKQNGMEILESGNTALVLANTVISAPNLPITKRKATYVFNKTPDGIWLCSIDNSYGHEIIDENV